MTMRKSASSAMAAPEGPPAGQLPDHLPRWLEAMNRRMSADLGAQVRGLGRFLDVRASERRILQLIPASGAIRITDLAAVAGMTKQALGEFVDRLERAGFVRSTKAPTDGRVRLVSRTERGDEVARATGEAIEAVEKRWREEIGPTAYDAMMSAMRQLGRDSFASG
jgi:DNA-binding MarR family transcriptional regulator